MKTRLFAASAASALILFVNPGAGANDGQTFSKESMSYGQVLVDTCRPKKIFVTNTTGSPIPDPRIYVEGSRDFKIQTTFRKKCGNPMQPGERCKGYVDFCPTFHGDVSAVLRFNGDGAGIPLYGEGKTAKY